MICAYGPYAASATGGNGWSRDFLAGVLTVPATPFYTNIGGTHHLEIASTILFCISLILVCAVYAVYHCGPTLRKRSPFAESLAAAVTSEEDGRLHRRVSRLASVEEPHFGHHRHRGHAGHGEYGHGHEAPGQEMTVIGAGEGGETRGGSAEDERRRREEELNRISIVRGEDSQL